MCYYDQACSPGCTGTVNPSEPFSWSANGYVSPRRQHVSRGELASLISAVFGTQAAQTYRAGTKTGTEPK